MANLVIRPASGAGNKVVVQDQAGAAVLTTADSGATIASGVTGGAGLSGMTSLGTVTAGNLSNTAIVYPAGHVIQVKNTQNYATQVFDTDIDTIITVVMTDVLASSICICFYQFNSFAAAESCGHEGYIYRESTNLGDGLGASGAVSFSVYHVGATSMYQHIAGSVKDPSPGTGTVNYYLKGSAYGSGESKVANHDGLSSLTVMEIAQ